MNFTLNNHLTYTLGDVLWGHRENVIQKFVVKVGRVDQSYLKKTTWLNEQYRTAEIVSKELGKDLVVMFSGGTDSEIVIRAFKHLGITPRIAFIRFADDLNLVDYEMATNLATELDIPLEVIDFDVREFYNSGAAAEFAAEIQCRQIAYLSVYHNIKKLQVPAVMGGEMLLRRHVSLDKPREWYYTFRENEDASAMRFSIKYNLPLVNEWFSYTPEMMALYLDHPDIQSLISTPYNYKLGSVSIKNSVLYSLMPQLTRKKKTTGYESLLGFNAETYKTLHMTHTNRLESSLDGILISDLNRMLYGE